MISIVMAPAKTSLLSRREKTQQETKWILKCKVRCHFFFPYDENTPQYFMWTLGMHITEKVHAIALVSSISIILNIICLNRGKSNAILDASISSYIPGL